MKTINFGRITSNSIMDTIYEVIRIKQVVREIPDELKKQIFKPQKASRIAHYFIGDDDREVLLVLCLNSNFNVIAIHRCHVGSLTSTPVSPREVFKACILNNASHIIVAHNHPSMNLEPSDQDFEITKTLKKAGEILDIPLLDHIIINAKGNFFSFKDQGYLEKDKVIRKKEKRV